MDDDEYRKQAADAQTMSDRAISPSDKAAWLRIAHGFMGLVRRPLRTKAEDFADEVGKHGTKQDDSGKSH
ncbi:MAG TPA: hypothetical protein VD863_14695 [Bradyrhizobium sp.]|nr:hypothetical protein [Bradyrhizobium sp.]